MEPEKMLLGNTTVRAEMRIVLCDDGRIHVENEGAGSLWCQKHGKCLRITLGDGPSTKDVPESATDDLLLFKPEP